MTNHIDIFDGGPKLESLCQNVRTIKNARKTHLTHLPKLAMDGPLLACNQQFKSFRCIRVTPDTPILQIKQQLNIRTNDSILYVKER